MNIWHQTKSLALQTPESRDRYVDFLRACSILVVVTGHWLIAGFEYDGGTLESVKVLEAQPQTQWLTLLFQVMPIFFMVGGYSNAVSLNSARRQGTAYKHWLTGRLERLLRPLIPLVGGWFLISLILRQIGIDSAVIQEITQAALIPTWFLAIYVLVVTLAPLTHRFYKQFGLLSVASFAGLAIAVDFCALALDIKWLGWSNYLWVWLAVHQLGYVWQAGNYGTKKQLLLISSIGWTLLAALIWFGPYPLAMVGSPDPEISNTLPPKITLIALALGQFGLILAIQDPVKRLLNNPNLWTGTILINSMIMTLYLWHISIMALVVTAGFYLGGIGLEMTPGSAEWWLTRPIWIAVLYAALVPATLVLSMFERGSGNTYQPRPSFVQILGAIMAGLAIALISKFGFGEEAIVQDFAIAGLLIAGIFTSGVLRFRDITNIKNPSIESI